MNVVDGRCIATMRESSPLLSIKQLPMLVLGEMELLGLSVLGPEPLLLAF